MRLLLLLLSYWSLVVLLLLRLQGRINHYYCMPCKRRKLDAHLLIGLRRVALSTARKVLEALPDLGSDYDIRHLRYDLSRARDELLAGVLHTVDLELDDGTIFKWHIGRPQGVLRKLCLLYTSPSPRDA